MAGFGAHRRFRVLGFRVFGFRVQGFKGFRGLGFRFRVSGPGLRVQWGCCGVQLEARLQVLLLWAT